MQKECNRSINTKIVVIYFSILVGAQIVGISFVLTHPSFLSVIFLGFGMILALPAIVGVLLPRAIKSRFKESPS